MPSEGELIARFQEGDADAFGALFDLHHRRIANLAYQVLRDQEGALDAAQEVFLRAFQELGQWRGEAQLSTWLYRTALNVCFERIRAEEKQKRARDIKTVERHQIDPEEQYSRGELRAKIDRAVRELPPQQQCIFVLKQYQDLRFSDIAKILEISEGGAKASYHKAVVTLRDRLRPLAPTLGAANVAMNLEASLDGV